MDVGQTRSNWTADGHGQPKTRHKAGEGLLVQCFRDLHHLYLGTARREQRAVRFDQVDFRQPDRHSKMRRHAQCQECRQCLECLPF